MAVILFIIFFYQFHVFRSIHNNINVKKHIFLEKFESSLHENKFLLSFQITLIFFFLQTVEIISPVNFLIVK